MVTATTVAVRTRSLELTTLVENSNAHSHEYPEPPTIAHYRACLGLTIICLGLAYHAWAQTASTGTLTGVAMDPTGAVVPGVILHLTRLGGGESRSATSDETGEFAFLLLPPGSYELQAAEGGFGTLIETDIMVSVTETTRLVVQLRMTAVVNRIQVSANPGMIQTDTSALGRVVDEREVTGLPLVTRNFSQIASLSPGVETGVYNAGEFGLGGTAQSQIASSNDGIFVHGARSYDNNYQLDGISINDVQGSASGSGGIPAPSPDSIQEFKVQTGLYDAGYGRYGGANVSLITKTGGNAFHGTVFEFFRNNVLNAIPLEILGQDKTRCLLESDLLGRSCPQQADLS